MTENRYGVVRVYLIVLLKLVSILDYTIEQKLRSSFSFFKSLRREM